MSGDFPTMESIERPLKALRNSGTVFGVVFFKGVEIVFNETPFSRERAQELGATLDDISFYFANENRDIDQMSFGFDGGFMLIVTDQDYRVVVLHSLMDEVDIIAKAARAFLLDFQMGIFAAELDENGPSMAQAIASGAEPQEVKPVAAVSTVNLTEVESAEDARENMAATGPIQPIVEQRPPPTAQPVPAAASSPPTAVPPTPAPPVTVQSQLTPAPQEKPLPDKDEKNDDGDDDGGGSDGSNNRAVLATNQPENTLPPPRKPKIRR